MSEIYESSLHGMWLSNVPSVQLNERLEPLSADATNCCSASPAAHSHFTHSHLTPSAQPGTTGGSCAGLCGLSLQPC